MRKSTLFTAILLGLSAQSQAYSMKDLQLNETPQPSTKRGKFKRRNKGRK
jgi:hypothetical protein